MLTDHLIRFVNYEKHKHIRQFKAKDYVCYTNFRVDQFFLLVGCSNNQKEGEKGFAYISSQKGNVLVMSLENFEIVSEIEVGRKQGYRDN